MFGEDSPFGSAQNQAMIIQMMRERAYDTIKQSLYIAAALWTGKNSFTLSRYTID